MTGSLHNQVMYGLFDYLGEAHQHQQGEEIGAFERIWQLLNAVVGEGSDDGAPLRGRIQTVQDVCHGASPIQTNTTVPQGNKHKRVSKDVSVTQTSSMKCHFTCLNRQLQG